MSVTQDPTIKDKVNDQDKDKQIKMMATDKMKQELKEDKKPNLPHLADQNNPDNPKNSPKNSTFKYKFRVQRKRQEMRANLEEGHSRPPTVHMPHLEPISTI